MLGQSERLAFAATRERKPFADAALLIGFGGRPSTVPNGNGKSRRNGKVEADGCAAEGNTPVADAAGW
jgi:hypothetical protein